MSVIDVILKIYLRSCDIEYRNRDINDNRSFRVNFDKISSILSDYFRPVWSLPIGAKEVYDSYEKYNLIEEDFFGNKYMHIKQIEVLIKNKVLSEDLFWINEPKKH